MSINTKKSSKELEITPILQGKTAITRTESLLRVDLPIDSLLPNELNPNEMSEQEFNMLYDNVEKVGITDPILVRPLGDPGAINCTYKIVGGHHRWEVAKLLGFETVPVTIINDPDFDEDAEKFQVVRHNVIRGKLSPAKFLTLYKSLESKYSEQMAQEMFGFASEEEFKRLIQSTANSLPPDMKKEFMAASKELKTVDDLAGLLNRLFTAYGDTVPYGYMIFDYGGHDHVWLRMKKHQRDHFASFANYCVGYEVEAGLVMSGVLQLIAQGKLSQEALDEYVSTLPKVEKPEDKNGELPDQFSSIL